MKSRSALVFEELEPRLLLSADLPVDITAALAPDRGEDETVSVHEEITATAVTVEQYGRRELVLVDTDTPDYQALVDDLLSNSREEHLIEVVLLDNNSDGISQVTDTLSKFRELDAVHIISHGTDGSVDLGDGTLNFDTLKDNTEFIKAWGKAVSTDGDLLIYGCNLAATADGQSLVDALGQLTGADVAASDDLTGSSALGGDWDLEYQTGSIEAQVALSAELQATWQGTLIAPALNTPGPAINYVENDPATVLDPSATVLDVDSEDFHRGTLSVSFSAGGTANDELSIVEGGVVDLVGSSSIKVNGNNVGRFSGGTGGSSLVISWNPQATPADAQAVLRQIGYQNTSDDPSTTQRIIDFVLTDGDGGTSNTAQQTVNVTSVNDDPLVAANNQLTLAQGTTSLIPNSLLRVTDPDNTAAEVTYTLTVASSNGTLKLNGAALGVNDTFTQADINADLLTYEHGAADTNPDSFTFTATDGVGGTLGATVFGITVLTDPPGNDAPVLSTTGPAISYTENDLATVLDPSATVVDVDSADFNGGTLTVSFSAGGTANDGLSIVEGGVVNLVDGSNILVNGKNVGSLSGGTGGSSLVISWSPQATPVDAQAVLRQIGYQNTSDDPGTTQRIIDFVLTDGDGGTSNTAQQAVNVSSVNDVPIATVDSFTVNEGSTTNLNLARNDTDADDGLDLTSITIVAGPANGAIVINADGTVDYTHDGSETVADSFTYNINDASGATSTVGTVNLSINPVNDAPIHNIPTAQNTTGDTPLIFSSLNGNSIMVADPDASGAPVEVTLSVSNGSLTLAGTRGLSFIVGEGRGDAAMTFTGTAADINAALNGLSFQADADYEGIATVQIITDDLGNVGSGGALNAMHRISVAVSASVPSGISQDTLLALDELILEDSFDLLAPEPMAVNNVNVAQAAEEAINAATPDSGSGTTTTSDPAVDAMPGSGRGVPTQADVSLPGLVRVFDQNLQSAADDRPSSVRLIGHEIRQGLMDPFTYAKMLNPLQPDAVIWESIEAMMEQMDDSDSSWYQDDQVLTTTTVTGLTVSFTVGYVSWLLRAGYLSASLLSVLPLWREFDPLPVLATNAKHTGKASGKSAGDDKDSTQTNDIESESIFSSNETS
jgi:hypothetical protein